MTSIPFDNLPEDVLIKLNNLCDEFERTWPDTSQSIESMVAQFDAGFRTAVAAELIGLESELRHAAGESVNASDYVARFPQIDPATLSVLVTSSLHDESVQDEDNAPADEAADRGSGLTTLRRELLAAAICTDSEITQLVDAAPENGEEATVIIRALRDESRLTSYQADVLTGNLSGTLSLGEYTLLEQLGSGGMGRVFKAFHRRMHRVVVVKLLHKQFQEDTRFRGLFEREMSASARLTHPNIVTAFDAGECGGTLYLVTEYIQARDLSRVVREDGPLPVEQAIDVVRQAATALQHVHGEGVIHRDVKPSNLLLEPNGNVKLLDLGLSRVTVDAPGQAGSASSQSGMVMGTAEYMAPEQAIGGATDERTDIYSLGCTLFSLLTGKPCYAADTPIARVLAHRESPIPSLGTHRKDVPLSLETAFRRMVAKEPDDRFQSMAEVLQALEAVQPPTKPKITPIRRVAAVLTAVAAMALIIALGMMDWSDAEKPEKRDDVTAAKSGRRAPLADKPDIEATKPRMASAPFSALDAKALQQEWAEHLGVSAEYNDPVTGIDFVLIPPGTFMMGSTEDEVLDALVEMDGGSHFNRDCVQSEQSKREVTIKEPFYIARTETTYQQFEKFADASGYETVAEKEPDIGYGRLDERWTQQGGHYHWKNFGSLKPKPNHPVANLTFDDATEFCRHYSQPLKGIHYRLPREAEWEFACRAGTATSWSFGNEYDRLGDFAVVESNGVGAAVGSRKPNNFGLFDMHGNVSEWCSDVFDWHDEELFERVVADYEHMAARRSVGVTRGGSVSARPAQTRSAARVAAIRTNSCVSFRVVLEINVGG